MKLLYQVTNRNLIAVFFRCHNQDGESVGVSYEPDGPISYVRSSEWHRTPEDAWKEIIITSEKELKEQEGILRASKRIIEDAIYNRQYAFDKLVKIKTLQLEDEFRVNGKC